jgi:hypothetical protein
MREFHDWRHTGSRTRPGRHVAACIMRMAGRSDFKTPQKYIDLAGVSD